RLRLRRPRRVLGGDPVHQQAPGRGARVRHLDVHRPRGDRRDDRVLGHRLVAGEGLHRRGAPSALRVLLRPELQRGGDPADGAGPEPRLDLGADDAARRRHGGRRHDHRRHRGGPAGGHAPRHADEDRRDHAGHGTERGGGTMRSKTAPWLLLAPFLVVFLGTMIVPIVMAIGYSFSSVERSGLLGEGGITNSFAGFDNYVKALSNVNFVESIGRMILFGVVQVTVMIVAAVILALLLESANAKWPGFFRATYFLPYGIPGVIATILWSFLYIPGLSPIVDVLQLVGLDIDFLGPNAVLWSIANIVTWTYTGYTMLIITAQRTAIPGALYEAAKIDGASAVRVATSIQLPLIRPAVMLTVIFSIIGTLQLFAEPRLMQ